MPASMSDRMLAGMTQQMTVAQRRPEDSALVLRGMKWASLLDEMDQHLLALDRGGRHSCRKIAELTGLHPGTVVRRLSRLRRMLGDPVVVALLEDPGRLSDEYRNVGLARWVHRRPLAWICRTFGLTRSEVEAILAFLKEWPGVRRRSQQA